MKVTVYTTVDQWSDTMPFVYSHLIINKGQKAL